MVNTGMEGQVKYDAWLLEQEKFMAEKIAAEQAKEAE